MQNISLNLQINKMKENKLRQVLFAEFRSKNKITERKLRRHKAPSCWFSLFYKSTVLFLLWVCTN